MKTILCLLSCVLVSHAQAGGYFRSNGDVERLETLTSRLHVNKPAFSEGYVTGVAEAMAGTKWCPTFQVSEGKLYRTVAAFMKAHPDALNGSARSIVGNALTATIPCG